MLTLKYDSVIKEFKGSTLYAPVRVYHDETNIEGCECCSKRPFKHIHVVRNEVTGREIRVGVVCAAYLTGVAVMEDPQPVPIH